MNSPLVIQCMGFTKDMVNKGTTFKLSLSLLMGLKFSMDVSQDKLIPSTMQWQREVQSTESKHSQEKCLGEESVYR